MVPGMLWREGLGSSILKQLPINRPCGRYVFGHRWIEKLVQSHLNHLPISDIGFDESKSRCNLKPFMSAIYPTQSNCETKLSGSFVRLGALLLSPIIITNPKRHGWLHSARHSCTWKLRKQHKWISEVLYNFYWLKNVGTCTAKELQNSIWIYFAKADELLDSTNIGTLAFSWSSQILRISQT